MGSQFCLLIKVLKSNNINVPFIKTRPNTKALDNKADKFSHEYLHYKRIEASHTHKICSWVALKTTSQRFSRIGLFKMVNFSNPSLCIKPEIICIFIRHYQTADLYIGLFGFKGSHKCYRSFSRGLKAHSKLGSSNAKSPNL